MAERVPELLCPAGTPEAARAALCNGADALYLGASAFGARANAGFDEKGLAQVIDLSHFYGRRVCVTVNTLVKQDELPAVRQTLAMLERLRVDAVLVQDLGVLRLIHEEFPSLCVHASTQMALHNAAGARLLKSLGVQRVVLARECSLDTIRQVAQTGIETEVFVHGAQCVCVSGQCRYSGLIGGRSGNRGRCAQPCRLPYEWQGQTAAWLSPRDLCLRDHLHELAQAGVASLKIEGRLKRPEYVAVVTRAYRQALDALADGRFMPADKAEKNALSQVFSRTFFPGYAFDAHDARVINPQRVSSAGAEIGVVTRVFKKGAQPLCEARLTRALNDGDGLQIRGTREQDIIYSGAPVPAGQTATLRLHGMAAAGDQVVRIDDEAQLAQARATYAESAALPTVYFDAALTAQPGAPAMLVVRDDRAEASVTGEIVQTAQSAPLDISRARRALEKTSGSGYTLRELTLTGQNGFLSAAALNDLRRRALEALRQARIDAWKLPQNSNDQPWPAPVAAEKNAPRLYVQSGDPALLAPLMEAGADAVIYAPTDFTEPAFTQALSRLPENAYVALPVQLTDAAFTHVMDALRARGLRPVAGSVGQLSPQTPMLAGEGVPCWNHLAADTLRQLGVQAAVLPRELSRGEIARLAEQCDLPLILPVYGRARLMYLNHCPARTALGLSGDRAHCALCAQGRGCRGQALTDRLGAQFPLLPVRLEEGCLVQLLSCRTRALGESAERRFSWLLDFTLESADECLRLTRAYRAALDGGAAPPAGYLERYDTGVE